MKTAITRIEEHLMVQMRVIIWKQWKVPKKREWGLKKLGVKPWIAHEQSYIKGYMNPRIIFKYALIELNT